MSQVHKALRQIEALSLSLEGSDAEHWRIAFVQTLLAQFRSSGDITFEAVHRLLTQHEQAFLADLETARRMYRTYPQLFNERPAQAKTAQA
jgi:hypothetical protein